jgi:hypothetical protein
MEEYELAKNIIGSCLIFNQINYQKSNLLENFVDQIINCFSKVGFKVQLFPNNVNKIEITKSVIENKYTLNDSCFIIIILNDNNGQTNPDVISKDDIPTLINFLAKCQKFIEKPKIIFKSVYEFENFDIIENFSPYFFPFHEPDILFVSTIENYQSGVKTVFEILSDLFDLNTTLHHDILKILTLIAFQISKKNKQEIIPLIVQTLTKKLILISKKKEIMSLNFKKNENINKVND